MLCESRVKIFLKKNKDFDFLKLDSIEFFLMNKNDCVFYDNNIDFYFYDKIGNYKIYSINRNIINWIEFENFIEDCKEILQEDYIYMAQKILILKE